MEISRDYLKPIQLLYSLELHCNRCKTKTKQYKSDRKKLNLEAKKFHPKRAAAAIVSAKIKDIVELDNSDND